MIYWTTIYYEKYPALFSVGTIGSTYDIDFVVSMRESCKACHDHWGGKLLTPKADDPTPELGILLFNEDSIDQLEVDLLGSLIRLTKRDINKLRNPIAEDDPKLASMYVLTEWAVLLNRVYNTISLQKYRDDEALPQNTLLLINSIDH